MPYHLIWHFLYNKLKWAISLKVHNFPGYRVGDFHRIGEFLKDLDLTEGCSTGIPKILRAMKNNGSPKPIFDTDEDRSYLLITLPVHQEMLQLDLDTDLDTDLDIKVGNLSNLVVNLLINLQNNEKGISELMNNLNIFHKPHFRKSYLLPAIEEKLIEMTIPEKPTSRNQKYRLTKLGKLVIKNKV